MSNIQFSGFRTPYDEEQAFKRHMTYLKTKQRTSTDIQKQLLNNELGINQVMGMPKTSAEILEDEQEINKLVQSYLVSFFTDNPNLSKQFSETDAQYENRKYPSRYVFNNLSQEDKKILLQQYPAIKTQLKDVAILTPEYFLNFIKNYKSALQRSGGVSGFSSNSGIDELKAILIELPKKEDLEKLQNLIIDIKAETDKSDEELIDLLDMLTKEVFKIYKYMPRFEDIDNLQTALELKIDDGNDQSKIDEVIENMEKLPTRMEIFRMGEILLQSIDNNLSTEDLKDKINEILNNIGGNDDLLMTIQSQLNNIKRKVNSTSETLNDISSKTDMRLKEGLVNKYYKNLVNEYIEQSNYNLPPDKQLTAKKLKDEERMKLRVRAELIANSVLLQEKEGQYFNTSKDDQQIPIAYSDIPYQQQPLGKEMTTAENIDEGGKGMIANRVKNKIHPKFITKAKMIGKGVTINETPKYIEFGKYCLSIPDLNNEILRVKYQKTMVDVPNFKKNISVEFVDFIENFIDTQKINDRQLEKLSKEEQKLFKRLINKSGLDVKYKVKDYKDENDVKEEDRFNLVKGQYMAGNDNPRVKEELRKFIIKFMMEGKINKKEGQDILFQLSM
jgi:hypothetical protein